VIAALQTGLPLSIELLVILGITAGMLVTSLVGVFYTELIAEDSTDDVDSGP